MKKDFLLKRVLMGSLLPITLVLPGCGTHSAKDFGGSWRQANRFGEAPTEIPLNQSYTYYASPMDETLRTMLRRWAKDSGMQLSYQLQSDYTLYKAITKIHTTDVREAASELSAIYAAQGVSVTTDDREILVRAVKAASGSSTEASASPSTASASAK